MTPQRQSSVLSLQSSVCRLLLLLSVLLFHPSSFFGQTPYTIRVTDGSTTGTVSTLHLDGAVLTLDGRVARFAVSGGGSGGGLSTNEVNELIGSTGSNLFLTGFTELDPHFAAWLGSNTWSTLWDPAGSAAAVSNALSAAIDGKLSSTVTNAGVTGISNGVAVAAGIVTNFTAAAGGGSVTLTNTGNAAGVVNGSGATWGVGTAQTSGVWLDAITTNGVVIPNNLTTTIPFVFGGGTTNLLTGVPGHWFVGTTSLWRVSGSLGFKPDGIGDFRIYPEVATNGVTTRRLSTIVVASSSFPGVSINAWWVLYPNTTNRFVVFTNTGQLTNLATDVEAQYSVRTQLRLEWVKDLP